MAKSKAELIREIAQKEEALHLYDFQADGLPLYSFIRRSVRKTIIENQGFYVMETTLKLNKRLVLKSLLASCVHLFKLKFFRQHYSTVFYSFPRVDKIQGIYLDKFTDPLIALGDFGKDYIILDHGRAGVHPKPRLHNDKVVYIDFLHVIATTYSKLAYRHFAKKNKDVISQLFSILEESFGVTFNQKKLLQELLTRYALSFLIRRLFHQIQAKRFLGPTRLTAFFFAAHQEGVKCYELQHGITYDVTIPYTGYRDERFLPDYFLAFGENKPLDVYGIDEKRIVNIGWALQAYIARNATSKPVSENDILVISDPGKTDNILDAVVLLAKACPKCTFYIRTHPHEMLLESHLATIENFPNILVQDKTININEALQSFNHVIGENSSVMYEAIAVGKKVGRLDMCGLSPRFLEQKDEASFWFIHNPEDFQTFLQDDISSKTVRSIYSPFSKERLNQILGLPNS